MFRQKSLHARIQLEPILRISEAVSFILGNHIIDVFPRFTQFFDNAIAFGFCHSWVIRPLNHKQRRSNFIHVINRRPRFQILEHLRIVWITYISIPGTLKKRLPIWGKALDQTNKAARTPIINTTSKHFWSYGKADESRVSAITAAVNADAFRIGRVSRNRPPNSIDKVVMHFAGKLMFSRMLKGFPVSGG